MTNWTNCVKNMAWNHPLDKNAAKCTPKASHKGVLLGLTVGVAIAGVVYLMFRSSDEVETEKTKQSRVIKEVTPAALKQSKNENVIVTNTTVEKVLPEKPKDLGFYTNKLGEVKRRTGKQVVIYSSAEPPVFSNRAEQVIDAVLDTKPGEMCYAYIPRNFQQIFEQSLLEKIVINDDDTPEVRAKKERMIEVKKELRERWRAGENVADIIKEEQKVLQKKYEDYRFYQDELRKLRSSGATEEEIACYALAAKKAMKERQIDLPLHVNYQEHKAVQQIKEELKK